MHLIGLGRSRIAHIGHKTRRSPEHAARYAGYAKALREAGADGNENLTEPADNSEIQGYNAVRRLLDRGEAFDAIFAVTDLIAIGAIRALQEAGLRVPDDVGVVGFDDMPLAEYVTPGLTTVQQNARMAGDGLVEGIVNLIQGKPVTSEFMPPKLIVRDSCGAKA